MKSVFTCIRYEPEFELVAVISVLNLKGLPFNASEHAFENADTRNADTW